jgi:hypothetical protein
MLRLSLLKEENHMNPIDPNFNSATIIHGDLLHILPHFPTGCLAASSPTRPRLWRRGPKRPPEVYRRQVFRHEGQEPFP